MADLSITIGSTTKLFDLAIEQGRKLFAITEEPVIPLRTLTAKPTYGDLPPEKILDFMQNNWRGGMGQQDYFDITDMYANGQSIDTREPNRVFLGPLINTVGAIATTILGFEFFANYEYAYSSTVVYRLNSGSTAWDTVLTIAGDTISCMGQYDGYLYVGLTTGKYYYSANGTSWTLCTLANAIANLLCTAPPYSGTKDMLVLATRPNIVRTSISPLNGGVGWIDPPYYIGDANSNITSLFILNGTLFIGKEDGLYALPVDGRPVALTPELKQERTASQFKYWTSWQGAFYGAVSGDIMEILATSSQVYSIDYMGPLELSPELLLVGSVQGLTADDKNIYAVFRIGSDYIIYCGRQRRDTYYGLRWEWFPYIYLGSNICGSVRIMQRTGANPKLWFSYGTNVANVVLALSPNHPLGDSNYRFCSQGFLITTYFDANYDTWYKILYQLWTIAQNLDTTHQYIKVYYEKDADTSWTLLATITGNGVQSINLAALSCQEVRLKIELNSDNSTKTPILTEYIYRGILQPEVAKTLDFTVVLGQSDSRKPSNDLTFLESGRTATSPIVLKDLRFGTTRYVTFLPGAPMEVEVVDEASKLPTYRARILAQQNNWTPP